MIWDKQIKLCRTLTSHSKVSIALNRGNKCGGIIKTHFNQLKILPYLKQGHVWSINDSAEKSQKTYKVE
jgi:hypothetical protein